MLTKTKVVIAAALVLGSASATLAQAMIPEYDADGNPILGQYDVLAVPQPRAVGRRVAQPIAPPPRAINGPEWQRTFDSWLQ
jgi:hypothetical protein